MSNIKKMALQACTIGTGLCNGWKGCECWSTLPLLPFCSSEYAQQDSRSAKSQCIYRSRLWHLPCLGTFWTRHTLAFSSFDWMSTMLLRDFWFLLWVDYQMIRYRSDTQILLLPICFIIRVYFEIMECFNEEILEENCISAVNYASCCPKALCN